MNRTKEFIFNCLIVEDDPISQNMLEAILKEFNFFSGIYKVNSIDSAIELITKELIHVMFLDIEIPIKSGLEILSSNQINSIQTIIISSDQKNAFHGFEYGAVDFILKPPTMNRVHVAINKLIKKIDFSERKEPDYFFVKTGKSKLHRISVREIHYVESVSNHVSIYYGNGARIVTSGTLKSIEERLPEGFLRVHYSYLVHLEKITGIEGNCVIVNNKPIPVSRSNWKALSRRLEFI